MANLGYVLMAIAFGISLFNIIDMIEQRQKTDVLSILVAVSYINYIITNF